MKTSNLRPVNAKEVFKKCGTCSQTFANILNQAYGNSDKVAERALDPLAGGIMNKGYQCGMLWGTVLAIGAESFKRNNDMDQAISVSVNTAKDIIDSFVEHSGTVNCKEFTGYDLSSITGLLGFMAKVMWMGINNSPCFNLAEQWAPEAIRTAEKGLNNEFYRINFTPVNCASSVAEGMGAGEKEKVMVSGFAGGMGLSGNACGALASAIWLKTLHWCKSHPGKSPPFFNNKEAKKIMRSFYALTNGKVLCKEITDQRFNSLRAHSEFINNGGCAMIINKLSMV